MIDVPGIEFNAKLSPPDQVSYDVLHDQIKLNFFKTNYGYNKQWTTHLICMLEIYL
jgi:hypothetical protein